jgi:hypothetical protein
VKFPPSPLLRSFGATKCTALQIIKDEEVSCEALCEAGHIFAEASKCKHKKNSVWEFFCFSEEVPSEALAKEGKND